MREIQLKRKANIIDISLGGSAFIYEGSPDDLGKSGLIRLSNDMPEAVEFKTVSDAECSEGSTYRKRGVKFEWKGFLGKKQLVEFIEEYGQEIGKIFHRERKSMIIPRVEFSPVDDNNKLPVLILIRNRKAKRSVSLSGMN